MSKLNEKYIKQQIIAKISEMGYTVEESTKQALINAQSIEDSEMATDVFTHIIQNIEIARQKNFPLCQDTGLVVFWVKIGKEFGIDGNLPFVSGSQVHLKKTGKNGINLDSLLNESVKEAFKLNNFRNSIVIDPINRINTNDNTPAVIHYDFIEEDKLEISMMLKGGGSENMSALKMLKPADGISGIRDFVLQTVKNSGVNACPPLTIGIGIGGNFETCALLAKKSLFRGHGERNKNEFWANEENYLLEKINKLNIGPMGLGGKTTALKVNIEVKPCHIASLPVAVNLECHSHRIGKVVIRMDKG